MPHRLSAVLTALCLFAAGPFAAPAGAAIVDMEGVAPSASLSNENNSTRTFNGFDVFVAHGHYWDSAEPEVGILWPDNGTDWLFHDSPNPLSLTKNGGGTFSIQSFDATFRNLGFNGTAVNHAINVVGTLSGGGTLNTVFTIDDLAPFQTFSFDATWTGLTSVRFASVGGAMAYDNIVVYEAAVPEPAGLLIVAPGLVAIGMVRRRRAH